MNREKLLQNYCNDYIAKKINFDEFQSLFSEINFTEIKMEGKTHKMPPNSISFKKNNSEEYPILFPIEMRNKHYIIDLMDILRDGLVLFIEKIRKKCTRLDNPKGEDTYYLLKWLKNTIKTWHPVILPGIIEGLIFNQISNLFNLRNSVSHQNDTMFNSRRGALKTISTSNVDQCFQDCMNLLSTIGLCLGPGVTEYIQQNMISLDNQRRLHHLYRKKRKQMMNPEIKSSEPIPRSPVEQKKEIPKSTSSPKRDDTKRIDSLLAKVPLEGKRIPMSPIYGECTNKFLIKTYLELLKIECSTSTFFQRNFDIYYANESRKVERMNLDIDFDYFFEFTDEGRIIVQEHIDLLIMCDYYSIVVMDMLDSSDPYILMLDLRKESINYEDKIISAFTSYSDEGASEVFVFIIETIGKSGRIHIFNKDGLVNVNDIFFLENINIIFFKVTTNNRIVIADDKTIYIAELDKDKNLKILFKINRFSSDSILEITHGGLLIELIKNNGHTGQIDIWDIENIELKHSIPIKKKEKLDGFSISKDGQELCMWYFLNNNLNVSLYNFIENTEHLYKQKINNDYVIEDLLSYPEKKIIIYKGYKIDDIKKKKINRINY